MKRHLNIGDIYHHGDPQVLFLAISTNIYYTEGAVVKTNNNEYTIGERFFTHHWTIYPSIVGAYKFTKLEKIIYGLD